MWCFCPACRKQAGWSYLKDPIGQTSKCAVIKVNVYQLSLFRASDARYFTKLLFYSLSLVSFTLIYLTWKLLVQHVFSDMQKYNYKYYWCLKFINQQMTTHHLNWTKTVDVKLQWDQFTCNFWWLSKHPLTEAYQVLNCLSKWGKY